MNDEVVRRSFAKVRLLAMDIDGVLTDGTIAYDDAGHEQKRFHVADGLGLVVLHQCGIHTAWISGRQHPGVERRAGELGVTIHSQRVRDKRAAMIEIGERLNIDRDETAYIGDDWNDLPAMTVVGCPVAVANAATEVKAAALYVTMRRGGDGAVREVVEAILDARELRHDALTRYLQSLYTPGDPAERNLM